MAAEKRDWHLDRKVTLGIISALLLNATSSIWWASRLDYTVQNHDVQIAHHSKEIEQIRDQTGAITERLARIDENIKFQTEIMREIKEEFKKYRP